MNLTSTQPSPAHHVLVYPVSVSSNSSRTEPRTILPIGIARNGSEVKSTGTAGSRRECS